MGPRHATARLRGGSKVPGVGGAVGTLTSCGDIGAGNADHDLGRARVAATLTSGA